jgi:hypothetical protein
MSEKSDATNRIKISHPVQRFQLIIPRPPILGWVEDPLVRFIGITFTGSANTPTPVLVEILTALTLVHIYTPYNVVSHSGVSMRHIPLCPYAYTVNKKGMGSYPWSI